MNLDTSYLELLLKKSEYEQGLGINIVRIGQTKIGQENVVLLEVKVGKGADITPHVHEHGGEICIPLTKGTVRFGKLLHESDGSYKMDGDRVETAWDISTHELEPGKPFEVPEAIAHHFVALADVPMIILFLLPETHAEAKDRLYCTSPTHKAAHSKE